MAHHLGQDFRFITFFSEVVKSTDFTHEVQLTKYGHYCSAFENNGESLPKFEKSHPDVFFFLFFLNNLRLGLLFLTETFQNVGVKKHLRGKEGIIRNVVSSTFEVQSLLGSKSLNITAPAASAFTVYRCVILNRWSLYLLSTHHKQVLFLMDHFV